MNGSLGNIHGLQFLGIARGNLKLGAGLVIMKVLLWNMDNKSLIYSSSNEQFQASNWIGTYLSHNLELLTSNHEVWMLLLLFLFCHLEGFCEKNVLP